jgi:hypothetical protein
MAYLITLYRVETFDGLVWTGTEDFFSYDDLDAELFETPDEAYDASAHLKDVYVEAFHRVRSVPAIHTPSMQEIAA